MIFVVLVAVTLVAIIAVVHFSGGISKSFFVAEIHNLYSFLDKKLQDQGNALQNPKGNDTESEKLLTEIAQLKKDKENELKLRLESEKQAAIALQRVEEIQKRMDDWRLLQDAAILNAKETMLEIGENIYQKIIHHSPLKEPAETPKIKSYDSLVKSLIQSISSKKFTLGKNYFLSTSFSSEKAKLLLCDLALIDQEKLYILDFKGCGYFTEYHQLIKQDKIKAQNFLKQKLEKYLEYLGNPRYYDSISNLILSSNVKHTDGYVIMVLANPKDAEIIKELNYSQKASKLAIDIAHLDEIKTLVS
jgi:hypothetical protein